MKTLAASLIALGLSAAAQVAPQREGLRFFDTGPLRIREQRIEVCLPAT